MRYYIYEIRFVDYLGQQCLVSTPGACEDALFDQNLEEIKAIVFTQAKALNNDQEVIDFTFSITDITKPIYDDFVNT